MKIILLPGLDGTGLLFQGLVKELSPEFDVEVISYDDIEAVSYLDQAKEIAETIKAEEIFIVEESYSGRVAYELGLILGKRVKGIVFLAGFISRPLIFSRLASYVPIKVLAPNVFGKYLLNLFGFNLSANNDLVDSVFNSLRQADKRKLKYRLRNISDLDKPLKTLTCSVIYVRPSRDLLVGEKAVQYLASKCLSFSQVNVNGGHFIGQSNPGACARVVSNAVEAK